MSDDWLKRAEELRQQNHPNDAANSVDNKKQQQKFYNDNLPYVKQILDDLGKVWKAQDANQPGLLGIGRHSGNDYYVYVNTTYENKIALYLFDKSNIGQKAFFTGLWVNDGRKVPGESLRVDIEADHFDLYLPYSETHPIPNWLNYSPKHVNSLNDLKAVLAELWSNGIIHISE